jgi:acetyl esterase/lipase
VVQTRLINLWAAFLIHMKIPIQLLRCALLASCLSAALGAQFAPPVPGQAIELWPEGLPGHHEGGPAEVTRDGHVYHVRTPTLTAYLPAPGTGCGTAIVFCPGGGYVRLPAAPREGVHERWFNAMGIAVFDLTYRFGDDGPNAPLLDVLRAIRLVRAHAAEYGVKPDHIGVFGGSAGGHVAAMASCLFDDPAGRSGAALDQISGRPDFAVMCFPVITMLAPYASKGSSGGLLGPNPAPELRMRYSMELHAARNSPPTFLVTTQADKSVPLENSMMYYEALRKAGVAAELHLYEKGPHGFGFETNLGPTSGWSDRCVEWLRFHNFINPAKS